MNPEQALSGLRDAILAAAAGRAPLEIHGGRSKHFLGNEPRGEPLDVRGYAGIVSYEPTELVVTARCGTPLAELEATLAERGQMLAFEPPHFGPGATIGGTIACGLSGPARVSAGAARDFVLGAALLDSRGELMRFGGQVMKNVAGYDVSRLLCGSYGVLGVIAEVSLKVLPVPAAQWSLRIRIGAEEALSALHHWACEPLPLSASCWSDGQLVLRFAGSEAGVEAAASRFINRYSAIPLAPEANAVFWRDLAEHRLPFFEGDATLWRIVLPSRAPQLDLPGRQLIEWGGGLRWYVGDAGAAEVRAAAAAVGGTATRFRGGLREETFHPLSPAMLALQQRVRSELDPLRIFNPGRLYAAL
ncbi:MAG: glycolate oxidase subunit GlcE [Burkholderiaceae bacterium]|jgi:glycolate oxidase FAD binding subunit|nr:glycolate oxidase subunit GlcE [Burkholderiaceae bacterium]MEB2319671.1 glycolate oxidase subunit GlcE [Pseudomonadota bacterium]